VRSWTEEIAQYRLWTESIDVAAWPMVKLVERGSKNGRTQKDLCRHNCPSRIRHKMAGLWEDSVRAVRSTACCFIITKLLRMLSFSTEIQPTVFRGLCMIRLLRNCIIIIDSHGWGKKGSQGRGDQVCVIIYIVYIVHPHTRNYRPPLPHRSQTCWKYSYCIFPLASVYRPALRSTQHPVQWVSEVLYRGATLNAHPI
jgi:hypothetical protein